MEHDPNKITDALVRWGQDWADKDAAASALEETRKTLRAELAVKGLASGGPISKAELYAEANTAYKEHIESMVEARRIANRAKVNYDCGRVKVDLIRTLESSRRAEMGIR